MQLHGLRAGCILISMRCRFVVTNWRTRGDRAGLIKSAAVSNTHTYTYTHKQIQPTIPSAHIVSLLRFHSAVPHHTVQRSGSTTPSVGSEGGCFYPANHWKLIITVLSDGSFPNDLHIHLNN